MPLSTGYSRKFDAINHRSGNSLLKMRGQAGSLYEQVARKKSVDVLSTNSQDDEAKPPHNLSRVDPERVNYFYDSDLDSYTCWEVQRGADVDFEDSCRTTE